MKNYEATEIAYKNGYEAGKKYAEHEILILKQKRANMFEILDAYERGRVNALKWIPVTERLPDKSGIVIGYDIRRGIGCYYYHYSLLRTEWETITHWMPLPEPPKEG